MFFPQDDLPRISCVSQSVTSFQNKGQGANTERQVNMVAKNLLSPWTKMWKLSARISAYGHYRVTVTYPPDENSNKTRQNIWEKCFQVLSQGKGQACDLQEKGITWGDPGFPSRSNLWPLSREVEVELKQKSGGGINEGCGRLLRCSSQDLWGQSIEEKGVLQRAQKFSGGFLAGLLWGLAVNEQDETAEGLVETMGWEPRKGPMVMQR